MGNELLRNSEVTIVLSTGTVITIDSATIEERELAECIMGALGERGIEIADVVVIRSEDVTGEYRRYCRK